MAKSKNSPPKWFFPALAISLILVFLIISGNIEFNTNTKENYVYEKNTYSKNIDTRRTETNTATYCYNGECYTTTQEYQQAVKDNSYSEIEPISSTQDIKIISINEISVIKTLDYPSQTIQLNLNGNYNEITITEDTLITKININGIGNIMNICLSHSPDINENGIDNDIIYLSC